MPRTPVSPSVSRSMKVLIGLLLVSNGLTGFLAWYTIRAMDARYSELIDRVAPALSSLQGLTAKSAIAMRQTNPVFFGGDPAANRASTTLAEQAVEEERARREVTVAKVRTYCTEERLAAFEAAGRDFTRTARRVIERYASERRAEALALREAELYPAFQRYQTVATAIGEQLSGEADRRSDTYSESALSYAKVLLGLGVWPLAIGAGLVVVTLGFVLVLMVLFRGREMSEP